MIRKEERKLGVLSEYENLILSVFGWNESTLAESVAS
jgi:hypothetical protein